MMPAPRRGPPSAAVLLALALVALSPALGAPSPGGCRTFEQIYGGDPAVPGGRALCERMWGGAFTYERNESYAYTMWFFGANPNEEVVQRVSAADPSAFKGFGHDDATVGGDYGTDMCHLDYFHKDVPSPEPGLSLCHPWAGRGCCKRDTVRDAQTVLEGYGPEYHWDRCGQLSPQCEAFFIQEACFYECEPAAGLYRKHPKHIFDTDASLQNSWELEGMPIRASYCDAWFTACREDLFCATDGGDYFSCALEYQEQVLHGLNQGMSPSVIAAIVVPITVGFVGALAFLLHMYRKERAGQPVFQPIDREEARFEGKDGP